MPVKFTNPTPRLLTVGLKSGATVHLAPGETSGALADLEVDTRWIQKLVDRDQLQVERLEDEPKPRRTRGSGRGAKR